MKNASLRIKLYGILVGRVPEIRRKYHNMRYLSVSGCGRVFAWAMLLWMNIAWLFGKRKFGRDPLYPDENKKIPVSKSESSLSYREEANEFAARLMKYDVISFDVFDTLIFRPFDHPGGLFFILAEQLNYPDFARIRAEMEWKTREAAIKQARSGEVTLLDIWLNIERECGIDAQLGMDLEISLEKKYCFANPYMLEVFRYLNQEIKSLPKEQAPRIITASDMYLPMDVIREIVSECGFLGIEKYFISCEYQAGKGDGSLYKEITNQIGKDTRIIHVGDNMQSDVIIAKKCKWKAILYPNINAVSNHYRAEDMSIITGSFYRGIINAHIRNGLKTYSKEYELGFIYGGLFSLGYCQFIHEYARTNEIDKILFLARDGDILRQVYHLLYPKESQAMKTEYVYWSRLAAAKMNARHFKYDYFRRFLDHKVNQDYSLKAIFSPMGITDMLPECLRFMNLRSEQTILTDKNVKQVKAYLYKNWGEVLTHYDNELTDGKAYYSKILKGIKRALAVDVGWAGSGAVNLDTVVNQIWKLDCEIIGVLAGTNTAHNFEPNTSEAQFANGKLISYLFSQMHNRDLWKHHSAARGDNLLVEMLLSSPTGGFIGFSSSGPRLKEIGKEDQKKASEIQRGIIDFVTLVLKYGFEKKQVSGRDAYAPISLLIRNMKYIESIKSGEFAKTGVE